MFFFAFCSFETNYLIPVLFSRAQANAGRRRPTAANDGQQRPMQAHKDKKGPKQRVWRRLGHYMFFFQMYNLFVIFLLLALVLVHVFSLTSRGLSPSWAWAGPGPSTRARLTII